MLFFCNALHRHPENRTARYTLYDRRTMASTAISQSAVSDGAEIRLLCLPYAGGGAAAYHRWRRLMPAPFDLVSLTLPGHDGRLHEPPYTDLRELAAALVNDIEPVLDRPFALVGCSMGAWLAFEMSRELQRRGGGKHARLPELLIVAASRPPQARSSASPMYLLPDAEFVATLGRRYGGIPAAVRESPELLKLLLPSLRADLQMVETYEYVEEAPLAVPIFALGGVEDVAVSPTDLAEWRRHTSGDFTLRLFPGGHFFLFEGRATADGKPAVAEAIEFSSALAAILARLERLVPHGRAKRHSPD